MLLNFDFEGTFMKPENTWLLLLLVGNSILFSVAYFALATIFPIYIVYLAVGVILEFLVLFLVFYKEMTTF